MNEKQHGKREAPRTFPPAVWWKKYRAWVKGLKRGQHIRYRVCLALGILAVILLAAALSIRAWIRLPDVPEPPGPQPGGISGSQWDASQGDTPDLSYDGAELPEVARSGRKPGYYTFLVAGQDVVSGGTDTILLFTYDTQARRVTAISLLRDTMINTSASSKRLNAVYARNRGSSSLTEKERVEKGMTALKQEVSKLTGIYPDFYVLVKWEAIGELVDAIGGVEFEVPFAMDYDDPYQDLHIHQAAGLRTLNGSDAMQVIRFRKNNSGSISLGDVGRTEIQRDFLTAVIKECLQPDILLKLPALAQVFLDNVNTDLSVGNILAFAELAIGMDIENNVNFYSMPFNNATYQGAALAVVRQSELLELLNDGLNPYVDEIKASDLQVMYRKSGGGFDVTNATLADAAMGRVPVVTAPANDPDDSDEDEETPIQPEEDDTQPGGNQTPSGGNQAQPGGNQTPSGGNQTQPGGSQTPSGGNQTQPGGSQTPSSGNQTQPGGESEQPGGTEEPSGEAQGPGDITDIDPSDIFPEVPRESEPPEQTPAGTEQPSATGGGEPAGAVEEPPVQDEAA